MLRSPVAFKAALNLEKLSVTFHLVLYIKRFLFRRSKPQQSWTYHSASMSISRSELPRLQSHTCMIANIFLACKQEKEVTQYIMWTAPNYCPDLVDILEIHGLRLLLVCLFFRFLTLCTLTLTTTVRTIQSNFCRKVVGPLSPWHTWLFAIITLDECERILHRHFEMF